MRDFGANETKEEAQERTTRLHTNPEQRKITKALLSVIKCETDIRRNDKGYVELWEVVEKTKTLHGLHGGKVVQAALKSQGRRGYRFKMKETTPGVFLIKARHEEGSSEEKQKQR